MSDERFSLDRELVNALRLELQNNPRPEGMDRRTYAALWLAAHLEGAVKRVEDERQAFRDALERERAAVEANAAYYVCEPFHGLACRVNDGEQQAFCDWAKVDPKAFADMLAGKRGDVSDWIPNTNPFPFPGDKGRQLAKGYAKPREGLEARKLETFRVTLPLVRVDWHSMTLQEAHKHATEQRNGPSIGVVATTY